MQLHRLSPVVQITNLQQQINPLLGVTGATVPAGVGSGVTYDGQEHILTNNHVIAGSQHPGNSGGVLAISRVR